VIARLLLGLSVMFTFSLYGQVDQPLKKEECRLDLKMIVSGLSNDNGQIKFDLDNNAETFKPRPNGPEAFRKGHSFITNKRVEYVFKDIPCGEYAIKLYHDANMNQDLDKNMFNVPTEQYGFSRCPKCILPPRWEKAKFSADLEHQIIEISL
jgi:uncharacterized protein (DUF2141 family)